MDDKIVSSPAFHKKFMIVKFPYSSVTHHGARHAEVSPIHGATLLNGLKIWASMELQKLMSQEIRVSQGDS